MRLIFLALLVAIGSATVAAKAPETQAAEQQTSKPDKEKKICRTIQKTGSRMGSRVCKTQAEWDAIPPGGLGAEVLNKSRSN